MKDMNKNNCVFLSRFGCDKLYFQKLSYHMSKYLALKCQFTKSLYGLMHAYFISNSSWVGHFQAREPLNTHIEYKAYVYVPIKISCHILKL